MGGGGVRGAPLDSHDNICIRRNPPHHHHHVFFSDCEIGVEIADPSPFASARGTGG